MALAHALILLADTIRRGRQPYHPSTSDFVDLELDSLATLHTATVKEPSPLLLMRMEALGIDPGRANTVMPSAVERLANVCSYCQYQSKCEVDVVKELGTGMM